MRLVIIAKRFEIFQMYLRTPFVSNVREGLFDFAKIAAERKNFSDQAADSVLHLVAIDIGDVLSRVQIAKLDIGADHVLLQRGKLAGLPKGVVA